MALNVRGARLSASIFVCIMLLTSCLLAACSSDGDDDQNDLDPLATVTARAANAPRFENGVVSSGSVGYTAELAGEWNVLPTTELPQGLQDTLISKSDSGQLASTIQVRCFTAEDEVAGAQASLTETSRAHPDATPGPARTVDGHDAVSVQYVAGAEPANVEREDVVFPTDRCVWTISLVNGPGARERHLDDFEHFLSTFKATP
jgi:hypothetical protein